MHALLAELGYRGDQTAAVKNFQYAWSKRHKKRKLKRDGVLGPKTLAALKSVVAEGGYVSEHFTFKELQCRCGGRYPDCPGVVVRWRLIRALEMLREKWYPSGLNLLSVGRCRQHNAAVGGASASQHLSWSAADISPVIPQSWAWPRPIGGVGYNSSSGKVAHIDVRPRWGGYVTKWVYSR